ncbi:hypothetical protein F2P56_017811 [Juglans regia]|uniref:CCHC-type domain-containing protein n=1 Tax=Juglans regia TaxID=51240 RepID=A0A833U7K2_JUGRE|nr:hypothetical protein F2P56_017811 [Juglans regia]
MSSSANQTSEPLSNTPPISSTENALIALNITTQINEKLMPSTFPQWRAQFEALLIGYNLLDYVHGISQCPSPASTPQTELNKTHWVRQDKLILSAILASTSPTITPLIATTKTSHKAWKKIHHMEIAAPIRAQETSLAFEELHDILVGHESYLWRLESSTQQLVASANYSHRYKQDAGSSGGSQLKGSYKTNASFRPPGQNKPSQGPSKDNRRFSTSRPTQKRYQPKCQLCAQIGHTAKSCPQYHSSEVTANCVTTSSQQDQKWLLDSTASHNITGDLTNLSIHFEYDGTDEVVIGDGSGSNYGGDIVKRCM